MSDPPSVLEEYMQCVSKDDNLKVLLRSKARCGRMAEMDTGGKSACLGYPSGVLCAFNNLVN